MKIEYIIDEEDVVKVMDFYQSWQNNRFVLHRKKRNVERIRPQITPEAVWEAIVSAILTTHSAVGRQTYPSRFLLNRFGNNAL